MTTLVIFRFGRVFRFLRIGRSSGLTRRVGRIGESLLLHSVRLRAAIYWSSDVFYCVTIP